MRERKCRCRLTGVAIGSFPRRSSSGCIATTGCTTASATRGNPRVAGASNGSRRKPPPCPPPQAGEGKWNPPPQLAEGKWSPPPEWGRGSEGSERNGLFVPVSDGRGIEVVARVVATGGDQPGARVDVAQRARFALLLADDLDVLCVAVHRQSDLLAFASANRDHVAVDALDFAGDVCATDVDTLGVGLAVALLVANHEVAIEFDLRPTRLLIAALDHHGGVGPQKGLAAGFRVLHGHLRRRDRGHATAEQILRRRTLRLRRAGRGRGCRCRQRPGCQYACKRSRRRDTCQNFADHVVYDLQCFPTISTGPSSRRRLRLPAENA